MLPSTHQILLDLKLDLVNLYDRVKRSDLASINRRLDIVQERIQMIESLEGSETDSSAKGILQFRVHNLLLAKMSMLQRSGNLNKEHIAEYGSQLNFTLSESARMLLNDFTCPPQLNNAVALVSGLR